MSLIHSYEKYCRKVFSLDEVLKGLEDHRQEPSISIESIVSGFFYSASLRLKAISTMAWEIKNGLLKHRIPQEISDDTFAYGLNHLEPDSLHRGWEMIARKVKELGILREDNFYGYIVGVMDCIEVYSSHKRECSRCLTRRLKTKRGRKKQYYHRIVVLTIVRNSFSIPIGFETMTAGDDEVTCGLRLLKRLTGNLGKRFLDIVIGDAAYCTPRFFQECEKLGLLPGAVLKGNQENLLETARRQRTLNGHTEEIAEKSKLKMKVWDLKDICWDTADREVRVLWAETPDYQDKKEKDSKRKRTQKDDGGDGDDGDDEDDEKIRVFAFAQKLNHLPLDMLYKVGCHRWDIDASLFMTLTKHWHLKHKTLHFEWAYENVLSLRFIAYLIFMCFYQRHINSRRKNKIETAIEMSRMLYRSACQEAEPFY